MNPGLIALLGSGETTAAGGQAFEAIAKGLDLPLRVAMLETPAGFELNAAQVAGRVADYVQQRLQNYQPQISQIAARKKGTLFSPDNPEILQPLVDAQMIFFGPGSPTYTVRQLKDSLAWNLIQARHRQGAALVLASAASIAVSAYALPVYEIYKVGEDPAWKPGLNLLQPFGMSLIFIPHWNNTEGGAELDTSHCFMGQVRFDELMKMVPADTTVIGIDEGTSLIINLALGECQVLGRDQVHCMCGGSQVDYANKSKFNLREFGNFHVPDERAGIDSRAWELLAASQIHQLQGNRAENTPPVNVVKLADQRQVARLERDWAAADRLRQEISEHGWRVIDTADGPRLERLS